MRLPGDVCSIEDGQPSIILPICHLEVCFEAVCFGVADICAVEEGAEEEEGQYGEDPECECDC